MSASENKSLTRAVLLRLLVKQEKPDVAAACELLNIDNLELVRECRQYDISQCVYCSKRWIDKKDNKERNLCETCGTMINMVRTKTHY